MKNYGTMSNLVLYKSHHIAFETHNKPLVHKLKPNSKKTHSQSYFVLVL